MEPQADPKAAAQRRFATADSCVDLIEIGRRYATDAPELVRTLLDAVRPGRAEGHRVCELGFGSGRLLEEMVNEGGKGQLFGLDLSPPMAAHVQSLVGD
jgi:ubiquinone/menaquinone biosynthesis C-methylase UbiE